MHFLLDKDILCSLIRIIQNHPASTSTPGGPVVKLPAPEDPKTEAISRASRLEYKMVNEVYVFTGVRI